MEAEIRTHIPGIDQVISEYASVSLPYPPGGRQARKALTGARVI